MAVSEHASLDYVRRLSEVGIALSAEKDNDRLLELILGSARELTNADGGTLYSVSTTHTLEFEILFSESLGIHMGGSSGRPITFAGIPLYDADGHPNERMVAARAAVTGETVNVPDAYADRQFDFSGTHEFDRSTGYRSISFLTVPMRNHEDEVTGVLQLINARAADGAVEPFDAQDQLLVESLASQAAIAITKKRLIDEQRELFEAFIELIAAAIDDKSPYTGGHCRRVPELTMMLAEAAAATRDGPLAAFHMDDDDRYELRIAGWLHDCGKVTTPEYVVDKSTKLETIYDRIANVDLRFEVLKRDARIALLQKLADGADRDAAEREYGEQVRQLDEDREFLRRSNVGGEFMSEAEQQRVRDIGARRWRNECGEDSPLLSDDEIHNLTVAKGTLTPEERSVINHHIVATIKMLESLPYPTHLQRVPEFAGGHHERMDGKGYPRGLTREQMSVQARVMGIADIFEALTAGDRPYKKAMKLSQALAILGRMKQEAHIDPDLFDVFVREKVYLRYAETFLEPEQIDEVDVSKLPGFERAAARN